ncbi:hypothetical protein Tco_0311706 [Tanacetum coccineum]
MAKAEFEQDSGKTLDTASIICDRDGEDSPYEILEIISKMLWVRILHEALSYHPETDGPKREDHSNSRRHAKNRACAELPQMLSRVHHTFHVSNLKKCYADEPIVMPLEGIHVDDKLQFVEEPVEIMEREIKRLKRSRIPLVKVRWNSRRGPEFTWEREDSSNKK